MDFAPAPVIFPEREAHGGMSEGEGKVEGPSQGLSQKLSPAPTLINNFFRASALVPANDFFPAPASADNFFRSLPANNFSWASTPAFDQLLKKVLVKSGRVIKKFQRS